MPKYLLLLYSAFFPTSDVLLLLTVSDIEHFAGRFPESFKLGMVEIQNAKAHLVVVFTSLIARLILHPASQDG